MINTLYLPELREMLAEQQGDQLREFCTALHPARISEYMQGLTADEAWDVLQFADPDTREEIFSYFAPVRQVEILESQDKHEMAGLVAELPSDDRVDLLQDVDDGVVAQIMPLLPADERQDIEILRSYPEDSAGSLMTTDFAKLSESLSVQEALEELSRLSAELETLYYFYAVDDADHLRGVVSARQLVSNYGNTDLRLSDLMETDVAYVNALDDQEAVAQKVAKFDLLAIPVVDNDRRILGIITHDDVIDVMREEATEDAHLSAAVDPLEESYLLTPIFTLSWKRGMWLTILFVAALLTAFALQQYEEDIAAYSWLVLFIPLVISAGGNSGSQSATLVITAMATGDVQVSQWVRVMRRELAMGLLLGGFLASIGFLAGWAVTGELVYAAVVSITLILVVCCGAICGAAFPLLFSKLGLDPALMSNPFVAGIIDILGIVIYMNVALIGLRWAGS